MFTMAFVGFRHGHITSLYKMAQANENIQIAGAFECDDGARDAAEKNLGATFNYASYEDLLADPRVDIVAVGDYFAIRGARAIAALKAGKHILADKPLCTSLAGLDEIEALSLKTGLKVGCMLDMRYAAFVPFVRDLIRKGNLGRIQTIFFGGQHPLMYGTRPGWYFEEGKHGGVINDIAVHGVDLIYHLAGLELVRVIGARTWNGFATKEPRFKDCGQFIAELTDGVGLTADVSYSSPDALGYASPFYWRFTIFGTGGVIEFGANLKEVSVSMNGSAGVEYIAPPTVGCDDILSDFVKELGGADTALNTAVVLKSSRNTLKIQEAADRFG